MIEDIVLCEVKNEEMVDARFTVIVRPFLLGQRRIQICDAASRGRGLNPEHHGDIIFNL